MTDQHLRYTLIVGAGLSLLGLIISSMMLSQAQKKAEQRDKRLASIIEAHERPVVVQMSAIGTSLPESKRSTLSTVGWLFGFNPERLSLYPTRWWLILIGLLVIAKICETMIADFLGRFAFLSIPIIWVMLCRNFFGYFEQRQQARLLFEFPDALATLVRAIRVGIPVMEAVRNVSRTAPPATAAGFSQLVEQVAIGVTLEDALQELARTTGLTEYRFFATTLILQNQTGGTLSDTLESLADVIRKRVALKAKGRALTSEARSSSMVLSVLPVLTGLVLWVVSPQYISVMFTEPTGRSLMGLAFIMLACGTMSIHTIIRKTLAS